MMYNNNEHQTMLTVLLCMLLTWLFMNQYPPEPIIGADAQVIVLTDKAAYCMSDIYCRSNKMKQ